MRVFVAAPSSELHRAHAVIRDMRDIGHEVYDWTASIAAYGANPADAAPGSLQPQIADLLIALKDAEAMVLLTPSPGHGTIGAWGEFVAFLALNEFFHAKTRPVIVSRQRGDLRDWTIYFDHEDVRIVDGDDAVFNAVADAEREQREQAA